MTYREYDKRVHEINEKIYTANYNNKLKVATGDLKKITSLYY